MTAFPKDHYTTTQAGPDTFNHLGLEVIRTAWSSDFQLAPKSHPILVRHSEWPCPAVMRWDDLRGWVFVEDILDGEHGELVSTEGHEWTPIPD